MNFKIRYSTVLPMINLCEKLKNGQATRDEFKQLLDHEDYQAEFERYKGRLNEDEFLNYIMNIFNLEEKDIANMDLKAHHKYFIYFLDNIDFYKNKFNEFINKITPEFVECQVNVALKGLPDNLDLPEPNYIFTIGIGRSNGYVHKNNLVFDIIQTFTFFNNLDDFCSMFAHETHHLAMYNCIYSDIDESTLTPEEYFYLSFSSEGLAVKFCNNAEGVLSKAIYDSAKNIGLDKFTWKYLNNDFPDTMKHFRSTVKNIQSGAYNMDDVEKDLSDYWTNFYTKDQKKGEVPKLLHFRCYTFGNDIWGMIYDCFGKEALYDTIKHPNKFPKIYNKSLEKIGHPEYKI
ncbi:MAG: DUF5700 domain-containing putative Zn-dependent protease [Inconstantimicrobium porci]|uniref:DUF5700 domain-containing putative Zn-dependent protease n=1 Tax=Inconstantimicrobium porci TaxID=2652291 RepID=UPI0024096888|nr:DUF5700 domain-containing putative Zn-dependent protease [Inconstantimicrobium porci]MDD6771511.1 hypothetical protein [Inconstantimicrobium porci]MDY5910847.1 DUF5700 domain-containing putative Zn-dependent protease [Inconstantimicrobium porci]